MKKNESLVERTLSDMALKPRFIELTFDQMMKFSAIIETSNAKGLTKEEGMIVVMRGQELGISPIASLEVISMIRGKKGGSSFAYHYSLYLALIRKNLPEAEIIFKKRDHEGCVIKARRSKKDDFMEFSFLKADAQRANLLGKDNWRHYPTDLYCSKAVLRMGRILTPDVLLGLKDTPETILDWKEPLVDKISKPKGKGKKGKEDAISTDWEEMDKNKQEKKDTEQKIAKDAFFKASKKSTKKLALSPKKSQKKVTLPKSTLKLLTEAEKKEEEELQDNIEAVNDIIDEANSLFPDKESQKAFGGGKSPIKYNKNFVKPFNSKKKLGLKKKSKGIDFNKLITKEVATATGLDEKKLETKKLSTSPAPKKSKKEVTFVDDKEWEKVPIVDLLSYKFVEKFDLCHSKSKNKVKYDIITKGFMEIIDAYLILYDIEEGTPFRDKFKEIIKTKAKMMPVFAIYQKAFKETFPPEHYHDLMKGFYDLTEEKIKELIKTGEANVGEPGNKFWGGYIDTGYKPDHNVWIHEFLKKNNLFTVDDEIVRRISE